ncbi:MAG: hypothetical protein ACOYNC_11615, partial [Bacteroidales bacterium]
MEEVQELAQIIKMHRKAAKLSRVHLAELAGVGKTVIFDMERGKVDMPTKLTTPCRSNLQHF